MSCSGDLHWFDWYEVDRVIGSIQFERSYTICLHSDGHTHNLLYIYICLFTYILYTVYIFSNVEYSIYPNRHLPKLEDPPHIHPYVVHKRQSNKTFDVMHQVFSSTEPRWRCIWGVCNCWVDGGKERFQNYLRFIGSFLS